MWIWWLCRIFSVSLLIGSVVYFVSNLDKFVSNQSKIDELEKTLESLENDFVAEKESGELKLSDLRKEISQKRREQESLTESGVAEEEEINFLKPKLDKLKESAEKIGLEIETEKESLAKSQEQAELEQQKIPPLEESKNDLLASLAEEEEEMVKVKQNWEIVDANYSSLQRIRANALETYSVSFASIEKEIIRPDCLFYGDEINVEIENVSPKKSEFYTKSGLLNGIEQGFVFIVKSDSDWSEMPFYVICTLSRDHYSIFEVEGTPLKESLNLIQPAQKLKLIRSGEFSHGHEEDNSLDNI